MFRKLLLTLTMLPAFAIAQKANFVGDYLLGIGRGDTLSARLFISMDTFKLIYQVRHDSDYIFLVFTGTDWSVDTRQKNILLRSSSGKIFIGKYDVVEYRESTLQLTLNGSKFTKAYDNRQHR